MSPTKKLNVVVVEDSDFYNRLLVKSLENHMQELAAEEHIDYDIRSYADPYEFERNLNDTIDVVILDYYLGQGVSGIDFCNRLYRLNPNCKIIVLSQLKNFKTEYNTIRAGGANHFIHKKDKYALSKVCFFVEEAYKTKYYVDH